MKYIFTVQLALGFLLFSGHAAQAMDKIPETQRTIGHQRQTKHHHYTSCGCNIKPAIKIQLALASCCYPCLAGFAALMYYLRSQIDAKGYIEEWEAPSYLFYSVSGLLLAISIPFMAITQCAACAMASED